MKISTKGRYALRLMTDLAMNGGGDYVPLKAVSKRQGISDKYLEQITAVLCKAGYVKSLRGAQGGYKLANPPEFYTVGMILRLTEGSLAPVSCLEDDPNLCPRCGECETLFVWERLYDAINEVVDGITLADIMENYGKTHAGSYII